MKLQDSEFKDRYGNPINIPQGAAVQFFGDWTKEKQCASALSDAAPDLLAALEAIMDEVAGPSKPYSSDSWLPECFHHVARAAIAKAKGQS